MNSNSNPDFQAEMKREQAARREQFRLEHQFEKQKQDQLIAEKMKMANNQMQQTDDALNQVEYRVLGGQNPNPHQNPQQKPIPSQTSNMNQNPETLTSKNPNPNPNAGQIPQDQCTPFYWRPINYLSEISAAVKAKFGWESEEQWRARMDQELGIYRELMEEQKRLKTEETNRELYAIREDVRNHREQIVTDAFSRIQSINFYQNPNQQIPIFIPPPNQIDYKNLNLNTCKDLNRDANPTVLIEDVTHI